MASMYSINVELTGVAPLRFNRYTGEKSTGGSAAHTDEAERKDSINRCYWLDDEKKVGLYVPAEAVKKCLMNGSSLANLKEGRKSLAQYLKATVFVNPIKIPLNTKTFDTMELITVRIPPRTGSRVNKYFCQLNPGWRLSFELGVFDERRSPDQIKLALKESGVLCGLLDARPEYGRFDISKWEVIKAK